MYKIALIAGALILGGCNAAPGTDTTKNTNTDSRLADTQWVLTGYESSVGVNSLPNQFLTLGFKANNQLEGYVGCRLIVGAYTQTDSLLSLNGGIQPKTSTCETTAEDANFIAKLNAVKSFSATDQNLSLQLPDGSRLNFTKKFAGCSNPKIVLGTSRSDSISVEITAWNKPIGDLIANYEKARPDFVLQSASDSCTNSVIASVNDNTLMELRCDSGVSELTYKYAP